jgi:hypothetical protein
VCFVYGVDPSILTQVQSGGKKATLVSLRTLQNFAVPQPKGDFLLRPDRIMAAFFIDPANPPSSCDKSASEMGAEKANDAAVKEELGRIGINQLLIDNNLSAALSALKSKQEDQRRHLQQLQRGRGASEEVGH